MDITKACAFFKYLVWLIGPLCMVLQTRNVDFIHEKCTEHLRSKEINYLTSLQNIYSKTIFKTFFVIKPVQIWLVKWENSLKG